LCLNGHIHAILCQNGHFNEHNTQYPHKHSRLWSTWT